MPSATPVSALAVQQPELRWRSHVHDLPSIERELGRMWAGISLATREDGVEERRIAARSSVLNLVVIGGRPEIGERCGDAIVHLTGRHPSRTLIVLPSDPDGPSWIDAEIQAHCVLPREGASETCSERIYLKAGGEAGRHPAAIVAPLVIHDLPVTLWWPGDVPFGSDACSRLLRLADRLVVDGSSWSGDGLPALRDMSELLDRPDIELSDFALIRQSRWREAIASSFDAPDVQPFLRSLRRIHVAYASGPATSPGPVNVIRPLYHVAWLASRLGMRVEEPLRAVRARSSADGSDAGYDGVLRQGRRRVAVALRPEASERARGATLRVELEALRRGVELRVAVTAGRDTVLVDASRNGQSFRHRAFPAPRRTEVDMLAEVIESVGQNRVAAEAIRMAVALVSGRGRGKAVAE